MTRRWRLIVVAHLILGVTLIVVEGCQRPAISELSGEFTLARQSETVSARELERDFRNRLARKGSAPESVTCGGDVSASPGPTAHCDAQFRKGWKSGSPRPRGKTVS